MIAILLRDIPFEQDIRELFMAFYPGERYVHEPDENAMIVFSGKKEPDGEGGAGAERFAMEILFKEEDGTERRTAFSTPVLKERSDNKNRIKRALYQALLKERGEPLPWGTLTGIRPTKVALAELEKGVSPEEVERQFTERFFTSPEKASLCVRTAVHERETLKRVDVENGWSLYIGIPFCPTTCAYCSFTSYPIARWKKRVGEYIGALKEEMKTVAEWMRERPLQTVYMGGGTPTSIEAEELKEILECVRETFDLSSLKELTVESGRPDSITREKLLAMKACGVSRISINPQTLKQETLDIIGRRHTVQQFIDSFRLARSLGFDNINTDLIVGLPNETLEDVRNTMEGIMELAPDDVTVHSLAVKRAARINTDREAFRDTRMVGTWEMISLTAEYAERMGLSPYYLYRQKNMTGNFENVGYCRPGHEGLYNILIMEEKQTIIGCGAGTTSKFVYPGITRIERAENVRDPGLYIEKLPEMLGRKRRLLRPDFILARRQGGKVKLF